jgi:hypothetical protein
MPICLCILLQDQLQLSRAAGCISAELEMTVEWEEGCVCVENLMTLFDNGAHSPLPFDASKVLCKYTPTRKIPPEVSRLLKKVTGTHCLMPLADVDNMGFHYKLFITIS